MKTGRKTTFHSTFLGAVIPTNSFQPSAITNMNQSPHLQIHYPPCCKSEFSKPTILSCLSHVWNLLMGLQHIQNKIQVPWLGKQKPAWTGSCLPLRLTPYLTQSCILYSANSEKFMAAFTHYVSCLCAFAQALSSAQNLLLSWLVFLFNL